MEHLAELMGYASHSIMQPTFLIVKYVSLIKNMKQFFLI